MTEYTITIVEDNRIVAEDIKAMLENMGYRIDSSFGSGDEVIDHLQHAHPDLILMDIHLKGETNGIDTANIISRNFGIPIIYITAYADQETLNRAKQAGPYGYIVKPIQQENLRSSIEIALHKHSLEKKLRDQELWYKSILTNIGDGVIVSDAPGNIRYMNPVAEELCGASLAEAQHKKLEEIFTLTLAQGENPENNVLERIQAGSDPNGTPSYLLNGQGQNIPIKCTVTSYLNPGEVEQGNIITFRDDTRERKLRQILSQSESHFKLLYHNAPVAYQSLDLDSRIVEVNPRWLELLGYSKEAVIGTSFNLYAVENEREQLDHFLKELTPKTLTSRTICELQRSDRSRLIVELVAKPGLDERGMVEQIHCALYDITAQKASERRLEEAYRCMVTILDGIDSHISVCDLQSHEIIFMNKTMQKDYGGDFTGNKCWKTLRGEKGPCVECNNSRLLKETEIPTNSLIYERKNIFFNKTYLHRDKIIHWIDGRKVKLQVATDTTKRKELESQLRQAQKMESIGTLAGGIAHDFNNILSAVLGFTQIAMDELDEDSSTRENLQEVITAGLRAKDLVKHILGFARQTDGIIQPVQIGAIAKETISLIRSTIPTTIEVQSHINGDAAIMAEPSQIHQVFMNLCTNAAQAMEDESGVLDLSIEKVHSSERPYAEGQDGFKTSTHYLEIRIADTGSGIAPEIKERIFDPYFTTKEPGEGTGMGLAMVHGVVKSLNGEIVVSSELGRGTTFTIYLPISGGRKKQQVQEEDIPLGSEKILFVDDELPIVKVGCKTLKSLGYSTDYCTDSYEALQLFSGAPEEYDLVITDMTMPNMTGDVLADKMIEIRPDIPIILCTGYSKKILEEKSRPKSIRSVLKKPITKSILAQTIRDVLDGKEYGK